MTVGKMRDIPDSHLTQSGIMREIPSICGEYGHFQQSLANDYLLIPM